MAPILIILLTLIPSLAYANIFWAGLRLGIAMIEVGILAGILLEWYVVKKWWSLSWLKALLVTVSSNLFSMAIGGVLIAVIDMAWLFSIGNWIYQQIGRNPYNFLNWFVITLIAAAMSYYLETWFIKKIYKTKFNSRQQLAFFIANLLSTLFAAYSVWASGKI